MKPEKKEEFKLHLAELFQYLQKELKLKTIPKIYLVEDEKNSQKMLGKTGFYDPKTKTIHLFITERWPKDVLRTFSHECIHHWQHENQKLEKHTNESGGSDPQYAQHDPWLRQMEKQAFLLGSIYFRDWEDQKKNSGRKSGKKMVEYAQPHKLMHIAWDEGVIAQAMGQFNMFDLSRKSTKTLCGKKVGIQYISNHHPTCSDCIKIKKDQNAISSEFKK